MTFKDLHPLEGHSDPYNGMNILIPNANLFYAGYWYSLAEYVTTEYEFFYTDSGETIDINNSYLTFTSLNPGEYVIPVNGANGTVAEGSYVVKQNQTVYGKSMESFMGNVPSKEDYDGPGGEWEDTLGGENFEKSGVTIPLSGKKTSFIVGLNYYRYHDLNLKDVWNSPSTYPVNLMVPEKPAKTVNNKSRISSNTGDTIVYRITQKTHVLGEDTMLKYDSFSFVDALPDEVEYQSCRMLDEKGKEVNAGAAKYNSITHTLTYDFTGAYLKNTMAYDGSSYTLEITCKVKDSVAGASDFSNNATVKFNNIPVASNSASVYVYKDAALVVRHVDETGKNLVNPETRTGKVGDSYQTSEKAITGYQLKTTPGNASGTLKEGTTTVTYVYSPVPSSVIVKHVDESGKDLASPETLTGKYGDPYSTKEKTFSGYVLKTKPSNASGTMAEDPITVTYVYALKDSKVIVNHVDEDGNPLAAQETIKGKYGDPYSTKEKDITGYVLKTEPSNASGTMAEKDTVVTYVYAKKDSKVIVNHVDEDGNPLVAPETIKGKYGDPYSTSEKEIPGYRLKKKPGNASGTMAEEDTIVTYIYEMVNREVGGVAWVDSDADGIREKGEKMHQGLTVSIYRTAPSGYDQAGQPALTLDGVKLYAAYDDFGNAITDQKTLSGGSYLFQHLEEGTYYVVCRDTGDYYLTKANQGKDDTVDSDMVEAGGVSVIQGIVIPPISGMDDKVYLSSGNDIGLVRSTEIRITKVDGAHDVLPGAELELYHAEDMDGSVPKAGAKPLDTWVSTGDAHILKDCLLAGYQYTLVEKDVYPGYLISDPVTFTVKDTSEVQGISMVDEFRKGSIRITKQGSDGKPLADVEFKLEFVENSGPSGGDFLLKEGESVSGTTDSNGELVYESLNRGTYRLTETRTADGYSLLEDAIEIQIPFAVGEDDIDQYEGLDIGKGFLYQDTWYLFDCSYAITNHASIELPHTGGNGFWIGVIPGIGAMAAGFVLFSKKKRKISR